MSERKNPKLLEFDTKDCQVFVHYSDITLRDLFAGLAMSGMSVHATSLAAKYDVAERSYKMADAMLAERDKGETKP